MHFIKNESSRSIEKLIDNTNNKSKYYKKLKNNYIKHNIKEKKKGIFTSNNDNKKNITINTENVQKNALLIEYPLNTEMKIGISNYSNTCYINSIIQILMHNKLFIRELMNKKAEILKILFL